MIKLEKLSGDMMKVVKNEKFGTRLSKVFVIRYFLQLDYTPTYSNPRGMDPFILSDVMAQTKEVENSKIGIRLTGDTTD
jgi:hypothetical protein